MFMAIGTIFPLLTAVFEGNGAQALGFLYTGMIMGFLGGGLYYSSHQGEKETDKTGLRETILVLLGFWLVLPVIYGLPFVLDGMSFLDGWFEAVSAITTTGAWLDADQARANGATMLWRAQLHSMGGLVSLAAAAAVFVRPQFLGVSTVTPPFSLEGDDRYLQTFRKALIAFLPIYLGISLGFSLLFSVLGVPIIEAVVMGLSLIASGGFIPAIEGLDAYGSSALYLPVFLAMLMSGVNFILIARIVDQRARLRDLRERETPVFLIFVLLVGVLYWISTDSRDWQLYFPQIFNAASVLSTNGFTIGVTPELVPVLVTAVIGGSAVSTAGGIKIIRWIITFNRSGREIWKLIHPHGVQSDTGSVNELAVWIHFIAFTMLLAVIIVLISLFGFPLELAVTASVAVVANAGPLLSLAPGAFTDYSLFDGGLRFILAIGMVLGRMELVVVLALFNHNFWTR